MRTGSNRHESGVALITVVLVALILTSVGAYLVVAVDRNTDTQAAFTKTVAGFYAAEAGINRGAGDARNVFLDFGVPTDCTVRTMTVNGRTVAYQLSGCAQTPSVIQVPAGEPYDGLNALRYVYDLRSEATNAQGFTEAILKMRFETRLIPMFQTAAFYKDDLELTVGPPMVINGRMHTNGDLYLNTESCDPGARILGQVTVRGELYRGRKDDLTYGNSGRVYINNPDSSPRILGRTGPGDTTCSSITTRLVPQSEAALWSGRVRTDLEDVAIPGQDELLCAPWSCPAATPPGAFWQMADLRIVLNTLRTEKLDPDNPSARGPALYALEVYDAGGAVNSTLTRLLRQFVRDTPGAITYSDVPTAPACTAGSSCEGAYQDFNDYATAFPRSGTNGCTANRNPRALITAANYCNDFRYGGFYNWRERKPILMLNIDWMKLEEWNQTRPPAQRLFNPNDTSDGGLVIYATVRGANSAGVNHYGVRVYNAQRVRLGPNDPGVTFATDQAAYVMGNFNCRVPAESSGSTPAACGSNGKRPGAVVGDTLNVLSCDWAGGACRSSISHGQNPTDPAYRPLDERSTTASSMATSSHTFVNAGFLAGNDTTRCPGNAGGRDCGRDYYSGGLENYPRFHESWSHRFWYEGSFVAIATPKRTCFTFNAGLTATDDPLFSCRTYALSGNWLQGYWHMQRYSPPERRWFYDVRFDDAANLPPLSPRFVILRQTFFTEEFR